MKRYPEAGQKIGVLRHSWKNSGESSSYYTGQGTHRNCRTIVSTVIREVLAEAGRVPTQVVDKDRDGVYVEVYAEPPVDDLAEAQRLSTRIAAVIRQRQSVRGGIVFGGASPQHFIPLPPAAEQ